MQEQNKWLSLYVIESLTLIYLKKQKRINFRTKQLICFKSLNQLLSLETFKNVQKDNVSH